MDQTTIESFLKDKNPDVRKASLNILADNTIPDAETYLLQAFCDPAQEVEDVARQVLLHRQPWLILRPVVNRAVPKNALDTQLGKAYTSLRQGIKSFLKSNAHELDISFLQRFLSLPGIIPEIVDELESIGETKLAQEIGLRNLQDAENRVENQLLFAPTYDCNLACTYCYAKGLNDHFQKSASIEDIRTMFSWAEKQGINLIILSGGEPTVYCDIIQFLKMARKRNMQVHLTTNALYSEKVSEYVQPDYIKTLVLHYDQSLLSNPTMDKRFKKNLKKAEENGVELRFRYTLTETSDKEEWDRILDLFVQFNIVSMDYGCAFKNYCGNNEVWQYSVEEKDNAFETTLISFIKDCFKRKIGLHLCKPLPLCAFSDESLRYLVANNALRTACGASFRNFSNNLAVNPDLSTFPCNAIPIKGPAITEFESLEHAGTFYSDSIKKLSFYPHIEKCNDCVLFYRGFCQGSCLADRYSIIESGGEIDVL